MSVNVDAAIAERAQARARGDFAEADRIRKMLDEAGFRLRDYRDGRTVAMAKRPEPKPFRSVAHA